MFRDNCWMFSNLGNLTAFPHSIRKESIQLHSTELTHFNGDGFGKDIIGNGSGDGTYNGKRFIDNCNGVDI